MASGSRRYLISIPEPVVRYVNDPFGASHKICHCMCQAEIGRWLEVLMFVEMALGGEAGKRLEEVRRRMPGFQRRQRLLDSQSAILRICRLFGLTGGGEGVC
jgi:hypothetical protein